MDLVPWLMLIATMIFVFSGKITQWVRRRTAERPLHRICCRARHLYMQIFIAFYIGYFGAGAGILILAMLALFGVDPVCAP